MYRSTILAILFLVSVGLSGSTVIIGGAKDLPGKSIPAFCYTCSMGRGFKRGDQCVPLVRPTGCPPLEWVKLWSQLANVDPSAHLNIRGQHLIPPKFLQVPDFQNCCGSKEAPDGKSRVYCLKKPRPDKCSETSYVKLQPDFGNNVCPEGTPPLQPAVDVEPPEFLKVPGFKNCCGAEMAPDGESRVYCLLVPKPDNCSVTSYEELQIDFGNNVCPRKTPPLPPAVGVKPPEFLEVPGWEICVGAKMAPDGTSRVYCLFEPRRDKCPKESYERLQVDFIYDVCPHETPQLPPAVDEKPPEYLIVPDFQECCGSETAADGSIDYCLFETRPDNCSKKSYDRLKIDFKYNICPPETSPLPGMKPPLYLRVPLFKRCLGKKKSSGGFMKLCRVEPKPDACPKASYDALQTFENDVCPPGTPPLRPAVGVEPPEYLEVPHFKKCMGKEKSPGGFMMLCLFAKRPDACPRASYAALQKSSTNCRVETPPLQPAENHKPCLEEQKPSPRNFTMYCKPPIQPKGCQDNVWATINHHPCRNETVIPNHQAVQDRLLKVKGARCCLQFTGESETKRCLPLERKGKCDPETHHQLVEIIFTFNGDQLGAGSQE